jgi:protein involved in polysaccharide export with SLBB domain
MKKLIYCLLFITMIVNAQERNTQQNQSIIPTISVTIGGTFPLNGSFPSFISERVDNFISRIYNQAIQTFMTNSKDSLSMVETKKILENYSLRGIKLKHVNGEEIILDLAMFRLNGDFRNNPYLKNDDILIFPPVDRERNFFSISGAINKPGKYDFLEGDKLSYAIALAQGINPAYENVEFAQINRLSYNGQKLDTIRVNIGSDESLKRGDQIIILAEETQRKQFNVYVFGEVKDPGVIPITKDGTKLGDVIKKVGGPTSIASLKRSKLYRGGNLSKLLEQLYGIPITELVKSNNDFSSKALIDLENLLMLRMSNLLDEDLPYFYVENQLRVLTESSAMDFTKIDDPNSDIYNLPVKNGDIVIIPPTKKTVYVFGQVPNPGHVNFSSGKDYKYYINKSGGYGEYAQSEVMIIKGVSRNWVIANDDIEIDEGDYIFVPKERLRSFGSYVQEYSAYISIVGTIATVILLFLQFGK